MVPQESFADIDAEAKTKPEVTTTAVAEPKRNEVSTHVSGAVASEDFNIDHVQILGKSSQFEPDGGTIGDICVNKEFPLVHVGEPVRGVLVSTRKYWKENVPFDDDTVPRFANTLEEKQEIEETTPYGGTVPVCDVILLLERPDSFEDDERASSVFIYPFDGREFALVKYTVQKAAAVRENYGTINTAVHARATKGEDAANYYFELSSKEKGQGTKYKWHQFVLRGTSVEAPEDAVAFARSIRGK